MTIPTMTGRNLWLLLQGQFVTHMGNQIYDIAMLLWIKEVTGSASLMGLALLLTNLPHALLAPLGGKLADRFGGVRTMVTSDLVSALAVGAVAVSIWWRAESFVMVWPCALETWCSESRRPASIRQCWR